MQQTKTQFNSILQQERHEVNFFMINHHVNVYPETQTRRIVFKSGEGCMGCNLNCFKQCQSVWGEGYALHL